MFTLIAPRSLRLLLAASVGCTMLALHPQTLRASEKDDVPYARLLELLEAQSRKLDEQAARIEDQERRLRVQEDSLRAEEAHVPVFPSRPGIAPRRDWPSAEPIELALAAGQGGDATAERPALDPNLVRRGGVLTTRGLVVVEPLLDWSTSRVSQFFFDGIEIVDAFLIGEIEASETERGALTSGLGVRVGWSDRLELEAQLPFVSRSDTFTSRIVSQNQSIVRQKREGSGLGDLSLALHYQINDALDDAPITVANLRVTVPTGKGPFDVRRDERGLERELATGSGHFSIEPSLSVILPSDPTVLFANLSYQLNLPVDADLSLDTGSGAVRVGRVDPGDGIGVNIGMAVALNDRTSLRLGYDHLYLMPTRTKLDGNGFDSESLHIGVLEIGVSHRTRRGLNLSLSLGIGVTDTAPDIRLSMRVPMSFEMF
jgi:hypothetical protein